MSDQLERLLSANKELQDNMEVLQTELGRKETEFEKLLHERYSVRSCGNISTVSYNSSNSTSWEVKECVEEKPFIYKFPGFIVALKNNKQTKKKTRSFWHTVGRENRCIWQHSSLVFYFSQRSFNSEIPRGEDCRGRGKSWRSAEARTERITRNENETQERTCEGKHTMTFTSEIVFEFLSGKLRHGPKSVV